MLFRNILCMEFIICSYTLSICSLENSLSSSFMVPYLFSIKLHISFLSALYLLSRELSTCFVYAPLHALYKASLSTYISSISGPYSSLPELYEASNLPHIRVVDPLKPYVSFLQNYILSFYTTSLTIYIALYIAFNTTVYKLYI